MRFAYADPPYMGQAAKHYADRPDYGGEVDHVALIRRLETEFPDGWALSLHEPSLPAILAMLEAEGLHRAEKAYRVMVWVKPFAAFKKNVNPGYTWEPVIVRGGRKLGCDVPTVRDHISANITLRRGCPGAKPDEFCFWLFNVLGLNAEDEFHDLFPGSGAVSDAWTKWRNQRSLPVPATA